MTDTILIVIWPFAFALLASVAEFLLSRTKVFGGTHIRDLKLPKQIRQIKWKDKTGNTALSFLIIWTACLLQFMVSMVSVYLVRRFACIPSGATQSPVSPVFFAVADAVSDICILYLLRSGKRRFAGPAAVTAVLSYALLLAELFVFNFNCFGTDCHMVTLKGSSLRTGFESNPEDEEGPVSYSGDSVLVNRECDLIIPNVPDDAYSVTVNFIPVEKKPAATALSERFKIRLMIEDDNSKYQYRTADVRNVSGLQSDTMFMRPYGHIKSVLISVEKLEKDVLISSVTISNHNIYSALPVRYLLLLAAAVLILLIIASRFYEVEYDSGNKLHVILLSAVFVLTTMCTYLLYFRKASRLVEYPFENIEEVSDIYQLAFDSKMKKLPYLDIEAEEELKSLDNPYDNSERTEKNTMYWWDFAYKDGRYYCYFGEAPLYVLYYPSYLLTHRLPNYPAAVGILGTAAVVSLLLAFLAAVRMFVPKKNLLALLLMFPTVASASLMFINMSHTEKYYVASDCAVAGIGFAVFFGLSAVKGRKTLPSIVMFFLSGLSLAVCAGSRPTIAICAAVLLPAFFTVLFDKSEKLSIRLSKAAAFLVPVIVGITMMLIHNYERFGNILDFGENYQLTVSDISSLKVTPEIIPSAIFYYFLAPFTPIETFPFFEARGIIANTYEVYRNIEPSVGLLSIPFILMGTLFLPGAFAGAKSKMPARDKVIYNGFLITGIFAALFVAWFDFSRGGVCLRYLSDVAWLLAVMSGVVLLRRIMSRSGRKTVYGLICAASVLTLFITFFMLLAQDSSNFAIMYPTLLEKCEDFFIFWH